MSDYFKPDFGDKLFTVKIEVFRNGTVRQVHEVKEGYQPTYHEIVGAVEVVKAGFLRDIGEAVSKAFEEHQLKNP